MALMRAMRSACLKARVAVAKKRSQRRESRVTSYQGSRLSEHDPTSACLTETLKARLETRERRIAEGVMAREYQDKGPHGLGR